jgi:HD-like signal output (HDOD) protein
MREEFYQLLASIRNRPTMLVDAEIEQLGTSHCEIGLCMARKWNFPEAYCEVIALHHAPADARIEPVLCAIVNLADLFCCVRGLDYGGQEWVCFNLEEEEGWQILKNLAPHLAEMDVERFCYELDDALIDIRALVESIFGVKRPSEG